MLSSEELLERKVSELCRKLGDRKLNTQGCGAISISDELAIDRQPILDLELLSMKELWTCARATGASNEQLDKVTDSEEHCSTVTYLIDVNRQHHCQHCSVHRLRHV